MASENAHSQEQQHEQLLQTLSAMLIEFQVLSASADLQHMPDLASHLCSLEQMTRQALHLARTSSDYLVLPELEGHTLGEALEQLVDATAEQLGLSSRVTLTGVEEHAQNAGVTHAEYLLFLLAQETLYQLRQHQGARRVRLTLAYTQEDILLAIEDDGTLPTLAAPSDLPTPDDPSPFWSDVQEGVGNFSEHIYCDLRARLEAMGGTLTSEVLTQGTRVQARLPYQHERAQAVVPAEPAAPISVSAPSQPEARLSLLIVDAQPVVRAGLHHLLESYADLWVVGEAGDGVQAVSETLELGPQVVLLDAQLPEGQSLEALRQIKQLNLNTRVLMLSTQEREDYLYETLRAGADGYLLKDVSSEELAEALRVVARGEVLVQPQLAGRLLSRVGRERERGARSEALTTRELEVLRLLARGLRNKEIAARLYVSERTVNFHLANIYQKMNVSGRTEALSKALAQGLVEAR
ncbi:hypothetical protein KSD_29960 [Ktedonobacter sp. SOSP1-85]|uniref:helix-turn-helix transcriptional regulator n=1 Tax=Ktedonobacter sp. SOSP1-85 TaxID=2778367 RepID=UPI00191510F7|nr:response regulator transcription factor family protein [Ktedonobacter sp. SOSP1-85]GHO75225.1 hypothetical protein KSD_29960 [Ktedonobacter sp. SOSP1-85]